MYIGMYMYYVFTQMTHTLAQASVYSMWRCEQIVNEHNHKKTRQLENIRLVVI